MRSEIPTKNRGGLFFKSFLGWFICVLIFTILYLIEDSVNEKAIILSSIVMFIGSVFFIIMAFSLSARLSSRFSGIVRFFIFLIALSFFSVGGVVAVAYPLAVLSDIKVENKNSKDEKKVLNSQKLCNRTKGYDMKPEFRRALDLIMQRLFEHFIKDIKPSGEGFTNVSLSFVPYMRYAAILKCVDIKYADSKEEIQGAEGVFLFMPQSTKEHLQILVSPEYSSKDDLLTAILLAHELHHAFAFSSNLYSGLSNEEACIKNEAEAFWSQAIFYLTLNEEERNSILSRWYTAIVQESKTDSKAFQVQNQMLEIFSEFIQNLSKYDLNSLDREGYAGAVIVSLNQAATEYVRNSAFYQKQCGLKK